MATPRTERTTHEGPVQLRISSPAANVQIVASPDVTHAEVTISTSDNSGPAAQAVQEATFTTSGDRFEVRVDFPPPVGQPAYSDGGGDHNVVIGSVNAGVVNFGHGNISIAGSVIGSHFGVGNVYNGVAGAAVGPVRITARVPENSSINIQIPGVGSVTTTGQLAQADVNLNTGDTQLGRVVAAAVKSNVGRIYVEHVTGPTVLTTNVGDIEVYGDEDVVVHANTNVGSVVHSRHLDIYARANVGQVRGVKR